MKFAHLYMMLLAACILFSIPAQAGELPRYSLGGEVVHGGSVDHAKAGGDTVNLMSTHNDPTNGPGEPFFYGDFEDASGIADWNGWTHHDLTQQTETQWNVSTYNQPDPANHAAWCGDINFPSCGGPDPEGGYGNGWHEIMEFRQTVPNPGVGSTVTVTATLIYDSEPAYDFIYLSYGFQGQPYSDMQSWDGIGTVAVSSSVGYQPQEYMDGTDIVVYFRFKSDDAWSDEDCSYASAGACQVDDINVHLVNGAFTGDFFEDFEHGGVPDDFGIWNASFPSGVGDFAQIWTGLEDVDPCFTNYTPQVAFIDDGIVVPGTGGSQCINWCYGPGGYIVTTTGGLAGPNEHIFNVVESPIMAWPASQGGTGIDDDGISLAFEVFHHEDLSFDAPGIFYGWDVRSADTDGSAGGGVQDIAEQAWLSRTIIYLGSAVYERSGQDISSLMNPGRDEIQVRLTVRELGYIWGYTGNDGYPAPYFDNVTVKVYPFIGPAMYARELDLAQDNFPERQTIDFEDLGSHHVRFDMANNISPMGQLRNDPGDSLVLDIVSVRSGADFTGDPELHYMLDANPIFDPYRTSGLPAQGSVTGMPAVGISGSPSQGKWAFDLPDTGFFFPGDVLHYYISATDAIGGMGGTDPRTALMPADTTGFSTGFGDPVGYNPTFVVRALPAIYEDNWGHLKHPVALLINDFANRDEANSWYTALNNIGINQGPWMENILDIYYVNAPTSGAGNGIGGRAGYQALELYTDILYTCGNLGFNTISNGDFNYDAGDDIGTLTAWLDQGDKDIFLTGDDLASDMWQSGDQTRIFLTDYLGLTLVTNYVRPFISNQATPLVEVIGGNPVFFGPLQTWVAYGGCVGINTFDGVETSGTGQRIAEFLDPSGQSGQYTFSAATLNIWNAGSHQSRAISMPVDLMFVYTDFGSPPDPLSARDQLLKDVLLYFEVIPGPIGPVLPGLPGITFQASNYPNPFNPSTTIKYSMPTAGHLKLSIYDVRGQLVKTLVDGVRPAGAGQTVVWDGTDERGSTAASGVYFYEARALGDVRIGKTTLLK